MRTNFSDLTYYQKIVHFRALWPAHSLLTHHDVSNVFICKLKEPYDEAFFRRTDHQYPPYSRSRDFCPATLSQYGFLDATFYIWRKKFGGMGVPESKRLKSLDEENTRFRILLAEVMPHREAIQVALGRKFWRQTRSGKLWKQCLRQRVCRNAEPAGWQVCPGLLNPFCILIILFV